MTEGTLLAAAAAAFFEGMLLYRSANELRPRRQTGEHNKFRDERESKQKLLDHDVLASALEADGPTTV